MNNDKLTGYYHLVLNPDNTILDALKIMDEQKSKLLMVAEKNILLGLVSIGDIQRAILGNTSLDQSVKNIMRKKIIVSSVEDSNESIKALMLENRAEYMPILDKNKNIANVIFWSELFDDTQKREELALNLPVVIMAGGKGTRMKPLTNVIPKPLIPLNDKTIIETIMDSFVEVGCNEFYISVNYKSELIKHYLNECKNDNYNISYFQEEKPLGTAGSLFMLKKKIHKTVIISNCDIIIDTNYGDILEYHWKQKNEITVVSALKHYPIPYGTVKTEDNGLIRELKEKPEITFQINTGMYILEPHLLKEIPINEFFHMTQLIKNILNRGGKVGSFPISEGSWIDIGDWNTYTRMHS